jgi:SAM-dependent methyltransferase
MAVDFPARSDERQAHWQKVYEEKLPTEVSWYQAEPRLSLELIARSEISSSDPIIDVGGGASLLVDSLLARGFSNLTVLDISQRALEHARRRLGSNAERVTWIVSDVIRFADPGPFALWHDRAVFHFLTEADDRRRYVQILRSTLQAGGHLVLGSFALDGPRRCSGLDVVRYDRHLLSAELGDEFAFQEQLSELHRTPSGGEQKFSFYRYRYSGKQEQAPASASRET